MVVPRTLRRDRLAPLAAFLVLAACEVDVGPLGTDAAAVPSVDAAAAPFDGAVAPAPDAAVPPPADAGSPGPDSGSPGPDSGSPGPDSGSPGPDAAATAPVTVTYAVDSTTDFANPERGFYHHQETQSSGYSALDPGALADFRTQQAISLVLRMWYLADYAAKDFDAALLGKIGTDLDAVRTAGLKAVLRFAYSDSETASPRDATKAQTLRHLAQLAPVLQAHQDVIAVAQAGFVGVWGEWYYTDHFGDLGTISAAQWADRKEVVAALLAALPSRPVLLRTPLFKQTMYGAAALTSAEAFTGSDRARVGHHNDCFLASADDYGTYTDVAADKAYLAQETLYVPLGGETCATSAFSDWANASAEMANLHWSFLNVDYHAAVLSGWGANLDVARRRLGYRLALVEGTYPQSASAGGALTISFQVRNDGWAAPFNPRPLSLVLRHATTGAVHPLALAADPRRWGPGTTSQISETVSLAGIPAGSYALMLALPDPDAGLAARPEYSIRLANPGAWEPATGLNALGHAVTLTP